MRVPGWRLKLQDCWCFMAALAAFFHVFSMEDDLLFDFADQKTVRRPSSTHQLQNLQIAESPQVQMLHGWRRAASLSSWRLPWPSWRRDVDMACRKWQVGSERWRNQSHWHRPWELSRMKTSSEKFKRNSVVVSDATRPPKWRKMCRLNVLIGWVVLVSPKSCLARHERSQRLLEFHVYFRSKVLGWGGLNSTRVPPSVPLTLLTTPGSVFPNAFLVDALGRSAGR